MLEPGIARQIGMPLSDGDVSGISGDFLGGRAAGGVKPRKTRRQGGNAGGHGTGWMEEETAPWPRERPAQSAARALRNSPWRSEPQLKQVLPRAGIRWIVGIGMENYPICAARNTITGHLHPGRVSGLPLRVLRPRRLRSILRSETDSGERRNSPCFSNPGRCGS
jgi:hypothetical protein